MVTKKLATLWRIARAKQAYVIFQPYPGSPVLSTGFGRGDLRDLVLMSTELKISYEGFLNMINESAANAGELHALTAIKEAVEVIEGKNDVGN
jgi:hypothetical protein